jgi:aminoglycoside/choline kinase family phosphotransferase
MTNDPGSAGSQRDHQAGLGVGGGNPMAFDRGVPHEAVAASAAVPLAPEQISAEWLSQALGHDVLAFDLEQIGIGVGLLGRLFRISYTSALGDRGSVVAKFPTVDEGARMNVVEPMRFYEKEVRVYQEAAALSPIATPQVYAAHFDDHSRDFVLLLEDLSSGRMEDQNRGCDITDAHTAVEAMVKLHAHWWESRDLDTMTWLPTIQAPPYPQVIAGMFKQAWPKAQEVLAARLGRTYTDYGARFPELVQWFCDEGSKQPHTYCHGDFRLDNLFFGAGNRPVTVVDWQLSFRGRGGYDLAYFMSQSLDTDCRRSHEGELIETYGSALAARGIDYPAEELRNDYRRTVAFCFCYPIISAGQIEITNERHVELLERMTDRAILAIEDNHALDVLP